MTMIQSLDFHVNALDVMQKYPEKLFYIGNTQLLEKPKVSIVGTRHPFPSTKIFTHTIANKLSSAGFCIVSGEHLAWMPLHIKQQVQTTPLWSCHIQQKT